MAKGVYVGGHFFLEAELSLDFIVNECAAFFRKNCPFEIFTRASSPDSSLVFLNIMYKLIL